MLGDRASLDEECSTIINNSYRVLRTDCDLEFTLKKVFKFAPLCLNRFNRNFALNGNLQIALKFKI